MFFHVGGCGACVPRPEFQTPNHKNGPDFGEPSRRLEAADSGRNETLAQEQT